MAADDNDLLNWLGSAPYGLATTIGGLPGVRDTDFRGWLRDTFPSIHNYRREHPGWAMGADIAASFIPYVGWGAALNKAAAAGRVGGALGLTNRAAQSAATAFRGSPALSYAAGQAVRFAPVSAGITGLDYAGGRIESPAEAIASFGLGTALGAGFDALGYAATPLVQRLFPATAQDLANGFTESMIGRGFEDMFRPAADLQALWGFSANTQRAAARASLNPTVQEAMRPYLRPQQRGAALWEAIRETEAGQHPGVDVNILRGQYDTEAREIFHEEPDPSDSVFRMAPGNRPNNIISNTLDSLQRFGVTRRGDRIREHLTGNGTGLDNPDQLAQTLRLPEGWIHDVVYPGLMQTTRNSGAQLRRELMLEGATGSHPVSVWRSTPDRNQEWFIRQEHDGLYLLTTQVPGNHPMHYRARHPSTQNMDPHEEGQLWFSFRTPNPSKFLPEMRVDPDAPPGQVWSIEDRIPRGESDFLDRVMDFKNVFLSPETIRAGYLAQAASPRARAKIIEEMLAGPTFGRELSNFFNHYTAPTDHQLGRNPEARGILSLYQALFDAAEGRKGATLYGAATIPEGRGPITALFTAPSMSDEGAIVTDLRRAIAEDPEALELIRRFDKGGYISLESIRGTAAGQWIERAIEANKRDIEMINGAINALRKVGATDARPIPMRENHFGLSHSWDGSIFVPIYRPGRVDPIAVVAGGSRGHAEQKARAWIEAAEGFGETAPGVHRLGKPVTAGETDVVPGFMEMSPLNPGLLEPRSGMRGYEHEFEPYRHVDDFIAELDDNYLRRWRYAAGVMGDALTTGKLNTVRTRDPSSYNILKERIRQLKGQPGPMEQRLDQIVDGVGSRFFGTQSLSKAADAVNELNFHLLHGAGYIGTPLLNMTSVLQTQLPHGVNFLTSNADELRNIGFQIPMFGDDGLPRAGFQFVSDPIGLLSGGFKRVMDPDETDMAVFQELFNRREMGTGLANEYVGQDRTIALRNSENQGRGSHDIVFWARKLSSFLMSKTEQVSRTGAAGMALEAMSRFERIHGVRFTHEQKVANALKFVRHTNYGYFKSDRPMMFTTPLGSVFGNQKTWMVNYLFMMAKYTGYALNGNTAPLLFAMGTTTALGGIFAVPLIGAGLDAFTKYFADQSGTEYIYDQLGEGGNGISFGLPGLFGISLQGNVAAPGSNLAHDAEFFTSVVAMNRAQQVGRMIGRAWDDQVTLGLNPFRDQIFQQQLAQALAPRSFYRAGQALMGDDLRSAATGYPMVQNMTWGQRTLHGLGFRDVDIALQYNIYDEMIRDRDAIRQKVSIFGERYAVASMNNDRQEMLRVLQMAAVQGVDISSIMRSSQVRMRNAGRDMFGRNMNSEMLDRYQASLEASGL